MYQEVTKIPSTLAEHSMEHAKTYLLSLDQQKSLTQLSSNLCMTPTGDLAPATGFPEFVPQSAAKPQTKPLLCMSPAGTETNVS